ncbi:MAG TPA: aspartate kinase, partial [Rhodanobacteraceae bacterium]
MTASAAAPLAPDAPWVVLKFGGTSVATTDRWRTIQQLAAARRAEGARVVIVVSALAGVTDALKALCACAPAERDASIEKLVERHRALAGEMDLVETAEMDRRIESLRALVIESQSVRRDGYLWQAVVQAHGELLSSALGAAFMSANGLPTQWLDAREALPAREVPFLNERARALSAQVQVEPDPVFAEALAARGDVFITQGFIARDGDGHTVLLGRGGSDTSAAHFGALLRASRVEIWTDVAGMFTADPRQVPGARLLQRLDYDEAQEIATTGAKVLHARCISPCRRARVPLLIKDTRHPDFEG